MRARALTGRLLHCLTPPCRVLLGVLVLRPMKESPVKNRMVLLIVLLGAVSIPLAGCGNESGNLAVPEVATPTEASAPATSTQSQLVATSTKAPELKVEQAPITLEFLIKTLKEED